MPGVRAHGFCSLQPSLCQHRLIESPPSSLIAPGGWGGSSRATSMGGTRALEEPCVQPPLPHGSIPHPRVGAYLCPRRTPCRPGPGAGVSQAVALSHIFHPSRWRRLAGSVPAWVGLWEAVGARRSRDPAAPSRLGVPGLLCQRIPSLQPRGVVAAERGMRGGPTGFILLLPPSWDAAELVGEVTPEWDGGLGPQGRASLPGCSRHPGGVCVGGGGVTAACWVLPGASGSWQQPHGPS